MIPKRIIFTIANNLEEKHKPFLQSFIDFNPEYEIMIFNNQQQNDFIKKNYFEFYEGFSKLPKFIQKSDFFRLAAVHYYGGIYCDIDIECIKSLDSLLSHSLFYTVEEEISLERFLREKEKGRYYNLNWNKKTFVRYGNYAFGAVQYHDFLKKHMNDIISEIDWIVSSEEEVNTDAYEYWIYNTTATDRTCRAIYTHKPADLFTVEYPDQKVTNEDKLLYPLHFGIYGKHWCHGIWKKNQDR